MALKIGNQIVDQVSQEVLVLPRTSGDIIIIAQAVLDMDHFERYCKEPQPKMALIPGKGTVPLEDAAFTAQLDDFNAKRFSYLAIKSLEPSNIEWEKVKLDEPATWNSWTDELKDAKISALEVNRIIACVMQANALDEEKLKEARASFLQGLEEAAKSSGPTIDPKNLPSSMLATEVESTTQE